MRFLLTLSVLLASCATARATPLDFRTAGGPPTNTTGIYQYTHEGVDVTVSADQGDMLAYYGDDGFGVAGGYSADEIEGAERLRLDFLQNGHGVHLTEVTLTDFFFEQEPGGRLCSEGQVGCFHEWGAFLPYFGNGTTGLWQAVTAPSANTRDGNGEYTIPVDFADLVGLVFFAPGELFGTLPDGYRELHDYSVARVAWDSPASVPEPASLLLLGTGLVGLARAARNRRGRPVE